MSDEMRGHDRCFKKRSRLELATAWLAAAVLRGTFLYLSFRPSTSEGHVSQATVPGAACPTILIGLPVRNSEWGDLCVRTHACARVRTRALGYGVCMRACVVCVRAHVRAEIQMLVLEQVQPNTGLEERTVITAVFTQNKDGHVFGSQRINTSVRDAAEPRARSEDCIGKVWSAAFDGLDVDTSKG